MVRQSFLFFGIFLEAFELQNIQLLDILYLYKLRQKLRQILHVLAEAETEAEVQKMAEVGRSRSRNRSFGRFLKCTEFRNSRKGPANELSLNKQKISST